MTLAARPGAGLLRCPTCHGSLVGEGPLVCSGCSRSYLVQNEIPRMLDETVPGVADKAREAEGWAAMAQAQGWYEPDDAVDSVLPYLCRDLGWDDRNWRANEHSFDLLLGTLRPGLRVLEVGAAKCWGSQHVIAAGCTYVGTDILADPKIGLGRGAFYEAKAGPFLRVQADGESLPFADGCFDVTYCVATLHHALDLGRMVREMARVTRRGGHVLALNEGTRAVYRSGDAPDQAEERTLRHQRARAHALCVPVGFRAGRPRRAPGRAGGRLRRDGRPAHRRAPAPDSSGRPQRRNVVHADGVRLPGGEPRLPKGRVALVRVAVCRPQVPFAYGGAEIFSDTLVGELRIRGHEAEIVSVPFKWYPGTRVLTQAFLWRLLDLTETDGRPIDMVVATKFPSYAIRHPEKRVWLVHQFRQAYELDRTDLGQFGESPEDRAIRRQVQELDRVALGEATRLFATSSNVAGRLERSTGLVAEVLPHPAQALDYHDQGPGDFILSVNRLDRAKRIDLLIEAAALEPTLQVVVVGEGPDDDRLRRLAAERGIDGRVQFTGRVDRDRLAGLYATCFASYYAPVDEDFGLGPYESFLSGKPVITATDAGGPLDVVLDGTTGRVVAPEAGEVGAAAVWLRDHPDQAVAFGRTGKQIAAEVTWDRAIGRLLS